MKTLGHPFRIGQMKLRNRIVVPPMVTRYASETGYVTDRIKNYYEARARGGAGLIIIEAAYVHKCGHTFVNQLAICDDSYIPGLCELVETIHSHDTKVALQLHHGGRMAKSGLAGMQPVAPSPLAIPYGEVPRELTVDDIQQLVTFFAKATLRAKKAAFDGIEIHGAHGYIIDQFLSPSSNERQDMYGGSVQNRARFLLEVIARVRRVLGKKYALWCRIDGREYGVKPGITLAEAQQTARMAQNAGCDAIHVSAFGPETPTNRTSAVFRPAVIEDLAAGIKQAVTVPVIAVGRITPDAGQRMLEQGEADLIAIGKGTLADPELPNKVLSGRLEDINPCIICMRCRDDVYTAGVEGVRCSVNATLGREKEYSIVPAERSRKTLVVGGGPAGMETARVAALRGHHVRLYEKEHRLGGQLNQADVAPHKDRVGMFARYLQAQLTKLDVEIRLGEEVTRPLVDLVRPEVVVVATGITNFTPEIPGLKTEHFVYARDVLSGKVEAGARVIVIGGELVGCETAEFLAAKGKRVVVTRRRAEMALSVGLSLRSFFIDRLLAKGVTLLTGVTYNRITATELLVTTGDGQTKAIEADTIVLATGANPNRKIYDELKDQVRDIYLVGDCVEPRCIRDAIADGFRVGCSI